MRYDVYTDGACSVKLRFGGYAAIVIMKESRIVLHGAKVDSTNNEMELLAVVTALRFLIPFLKRGDGVFIYSDSAYIVNAINGQWYQRWEQTGWKTQEGKLVRNKKLWTELVGYIKQPNTTIFFVKVKGHSGHKLNEEADRYATGEVAYLKARQLEEL